MAVDTQAIITFTTGKLGTQVGSGECYDVANEALAAAGAKVASNYGVITPDADYVWGQAVQLQAVKAGDVLQYRNYTKTETTTVVTKLYLPGMDPAEFTETLGDAEPYTRPHHTAIVMAPPVAGEIKVMEQNVQRGAAVERTVGPSTIRIASSAPKGVPVKKQAPLDRAMIDQVKAAQPDYQQKQLLEKVLAPQIGKIITVETTSTTVVEVSGTVRAYRPQPK